MRQEQSVLEYFRHVIYAMIFFFQSPNTWALMELPVTGYDLIFWLELLRLRRPPWIGLNTLNFFTRI